MQLPSHILNTGQSNLTESILSRLQYNMIRPKRDLLRRAAARRPAQGLVEYGFILGGVALVVIVALFALGPQVSRFYVGVGNSLP